MSNRQSFGDFLNSAGPSTPRGRGGAGFRGGRGRGRGGGGSKADYSNVPLDYEKLNKQGYTRMDGFTVAPYGPAKNSPGYPSGSNTPNRGRGTWTPRGRGGPIFGTQRPQHHIPDSTQSPGPSGSATPVRGLGFRGRGIGANSGSTRSGLGDGHSGAFRGKGKENRDTFWGGHGAPVFVKAGELFKEGEVDVVTLDQDDHIHIEALPLSDPSAPQMSNLQDETEVEVFDFNDFNRLSYQSKFTAAPRVTSGIELEQIELDTEISAPETVPSPALPAAIEIEVVDLNTLTIAEPDRTLAEESPLFFVDIEPAAIDTLPTTSYKSIKAAPIGTTQSDDEKIVFVPKTYRQPEPISVPKSSIPALPTRAPPSAVAVMDTHFQGVFMDPRVALSRKDKKAAKREKRKGNKKKGKKGGKGLPRDDSDIEWGNGATALDVDGVDTDEGDDVAILRDYLAGTLLNAKSEMEELEEERKAALENEITGDEYPEQDQGDEEESASEEIQVDLEAMRRFGEGAHRLAATNGSSQKEDKSEAEGEEEDDWESSSGSQLTDVEGDTSVLTATKGPKITGSTTEGKGKGRARLDQTEFYDPEGYLRKSGQAGSDLSEGSEDDSDGSSAIGDLDGTVEAMFDDVDSSEEDDFFNGKSTWADETEWFIRNMEDALDGDVPLKDRKQRNKLFKAIETGDFGDDWPTAPVKKGKKNQHVPAELQDVWERDRQKKAEKKRQRELDRLVAEIEAHTSVRKKGRGKKNVPPISQAHLLPGSAAEVAAMFDISSEEEFLRSTEGQSKRNRRGLSLLPKSMEQVNEEILEFLDDEGRTTLALPPMDKESRKKVHLLAECYGLKSQSKGSGKNRAPVLIRLARSGKNVDQRKVHRIVSASNSIGGAFYKAMYAKSGEKKKGGPKGDPGSSVRHKDGDQVGEGAERIGMDNIGHRLLSKMGWTEGDRIGRSGGLEAPIIAIVKNTKSGLGA